MKEKNNIFKQIDTMISVVALIVLICITFIGVVFRYVLGTPFSWLEEVQLALIIWIVFCGGRYAFETNSHVAIDMIYDMFPNKGKKVLLMIIAVVVTVVLAFVCFYSIDYIKIMFQYSISTSILSIPCGVLYIPIPVSCICSGSYILFISDRFFSGNHRTENRRWNPEHSITGNSVFHLCGNLYELFRCNETNYEFL